MASTDIHDAFWTGFCAACGHEWETTDASLRDDNHPGVDTEDTVTMACPRCQAPTDVRRVPEAKVIPFSASTILPAPEGTCPQCACVHEVEAPHNAQSLFYQYYFRHAEARAGREERWPTWADALAHCPPAMRAAWIEGLAKHGIEV